MKNLMRALGAVALGAATLVLPTGPAGAATAPACANADLSASYHATDAGDEPPLRPDRADQHLRAPLLDRRLRRAVLRRRR